MLILQKVWASFLQTVWLGFIFMKKRELCFITPPPTSASFGHNDSWQALLIFSLTAHAVTKASVVHRKWVLISIFRMTSHTQCISSSHWLYHVVPRGKVLISLHYHYWSTSESGGIKISHYLTLSLYCENPSSHTCRRCCELQQTMIRFDIFIISFISLLWSHWRIIISQQKI